MVIMIFSCRDKNTYIKIIDFPEIHTRICQLCNDSIIDSTVYRTLLLRKEQFSDSGIITLEEFELLRLHIKCSDSLDFNSEIIVFNKSENSYISTNDMRTNVETVCNDCEKIIIDKPYYTVETRLEKLINNTVTVEDAVGLIYLCENCNQKYNLKDINILKK
jgi:hypothetical protein